MLAAGLLLPAAFACTHINAGYLKGVAQLPINPGKARIAFGSCLHQEKDQSFWRAIADKKPDVFVMLGDAGYPKKASFPTHGDVDAIIQSYARIAANPDFQAFSAQVPMLAIWDDNDFGASDAGGDYAYKQESRNLFLEFWGSRSLIHRPLVEDGIYCAFEFGAAGNRVQVILPDLRFNRSAWVSADATQRAWRAQNNIGPYVPGPTNATFLGETQWAWLGQVLDRSAEVRIFSSSIQFASEGRGWECWANFPSEKQRLLSLIAQKQAKGVVVISGDAHFAEVCRQDDDAPYPLFDITSSGLTETWPKPGVSQNRIANQLLIGTNFGTLDVDVNARQIEYTIWHTDGSVGLRGQLVI